MSFAIYLRMYYSCAFCKNTFRKFENLRKYLVILKKKIRYTNLSQTNSENCIIHNRKNYILDHICKNIYNLSNALYEYK